MGAAQALDPLEVVLSWDIATDLYFANRDDEALRELAKAKELFPNLPLLPYLEAEVFFQKGDIPSAHRVVEALRTSQPDLEKVPVFLAWFVAAAAREGRTDEARRILDRLAQLRPTQ